MKMSSKHLIKEFVLIRKQLIEDIVGNTSLDELMKAIVCVDELRQYGRTGFTDAQQQILLKDARRILLDLHVLATLYKGE